MTTSLGQKVKDTVTGLEGTVTARIEYLGGSPQARIEAPGQDGKPVEKWIEEDRLTTAG